MPTWVPETYCFLGKKRNFGHPYFETFPVVVAAVVVVGGGDVGCCWQQFYYKF